MNNTEINNLCISLAKSDSEEDVIKLLKEAKYWNNESAWRYYDDNENNFSTIGNQQSKPDSALVEKIINSVDAVLTRECLRKGIKPDSQKAPQSIERALKLFFNIFEGKLSNSDTKMRSKLAKNILLVATGKKSNPCYSIIDLGEGQYPNKMSDTFLSLTKSNKLRIPFVQGKFNMGGSGSLQFCGNHNMQLIISRRDPKIAYLEHEKTKNQWGFTVIRRENPRRGMRSSSFRYLAPNNNVLSFDSEMGLPLLPQNYPEPYGDNLEWGTFVKLYEYQMPIKTLVVFDLYNRLSLLMPNIALPIKIVERRKGYSGHSLEAVTSGLSIRLEEDKRENLEEGFPSSAEIKINGQEMRVLIYAFKKGKKENYAKKDGIIFIINGQSHGFIHSSFFERNSVHMSYLSDSILLMVDCSKFEGRIREDLFMNSRDRLREGPLLNEIEKRLADLIKNHQGLRDLRQKRRSEDIEDKLGDSKPLAEAIEEVIKKSPTLSKMFIEGVRILNPFNQNIIKKKGKFVPKKFPTFFELSKNFTKNKPKSCPLNKKFRIQFRTDAENEYLDRDKDPGEFIITHNNEVIKNYSLNLWNGFATLTVELPLGTKISDSLLFKTETNDISNIKPFTNNFYIQVDKPQKKEIGGKGKRKKGGEKGNDEEAEIPSSLALPNVRKVRKDEWDKYKFNESSALMIKDDGESGYDFYLNIDNVYLQQEIKSSLKINPRLLETKFEVGMVLIGISLLNHFDNLQQNKKEENQDESVYNKISVFTSAISPVLLPIISSLGALEIENTDN